jgi:hypothetical protein
VRYRLVAPNFTAGVACSQSPKACGAYAISL